MRRIIMYEFIKIFRKKSIIFALIFFSIINIYKINIYYKNNGRVNSEFNQGYWRAYNKVSGVINDEKINFVIKEYKNAKVLVDNGNYDKKYNHSNTNTYTGYVFGDMNMFNELYSSLNYCYNYDKYMDAAISKAKENIEFYEKCDNNFQVKNSKKIISFYSNRKINEFYNTEGYESFFNYDFSSVLIILILILGLASVFSGEKEAGMYNVIYTCKYGKENTVVSKVIASMIYTIIVCSWFFILDIISFSLIFNLSGGNLSVYSMQIFKYTPLNMKIWEFIICSNIIKLLGFFVIGGIIILLSSVFSESLLPFILSTGIITVYLSGNDFLSGKAKEIVTLINPISLLTNRELFKEYSVINIVGEPVFQFLVLIFIMIIFLIFIIFFIIIANRKTIFTSRIKILHYYKILRKDILNI